MSNIDPSTAESQSRLLDSLQTTMLLSTMPQPKIRDRPLVRPKLSQAGRGTYEDHKRLLRFYVCSCGERIGEKFTHSTLANNNGTAIDKYACKCERCGNSQEISFMTMRSTLQALDKEEIHQDRRKFPYI